MITKYECFIPIDDVLNDRGIGNEKLWLFQIFKPAISHILHYINLKIDPNIGGETFTLVIKATNTDGKPIGANLTSGTFKATSPGIQIIQFNLSPQIEVSANVHYALMVTCDGGAWVCYGRYMGDFGQPFYYRGRMGEFFEGDEYDPAWLIFLGEAHQFKEYDEFDNLFESYDVGADAIAFDLQGIHWRAQSFTPRTSHNLKKVDLFLKRYNGGTGTVTLYIRICDSDDIPMGADLCSVDIPDTNIPTGVAGWVTFNLTSVYPLVAFTTYALVLSYSLDMPNVIRWASPGNGEYRLTDSPDRQDGVICSSIDSGESFGKLGDYCLWFEEWGEPISPRTTLPIEDIITLEAIRNIEMSAMGRFYIDEEGNAKYESRFARNP